MVRRLFAAIGLGCIAFYLGCGGGGTTGGGGTQFYLVRVELPGMDPLNIEVGADSTINFVLAGYEQGTNARFVLTATSWALTNVQGAPGTLHADGSFDATGVGSATVVATWNGTPAPRSLDIAVRDANSARLTGTVRSLSSGAPIPNVIVTFYDNSNTEVGRATTMADGRFRALLPTTATKVNLDDARIPPGWYDVWNYRGMSYTSSSGIPNCHATFVPDGPLANGVTRNLNDPIYLRSTGDPPPPPPNGCT